MQQLLLTKELSRWSVPRNVLVYDPVRRVVGEEIGVLLGTVLNGGVVKVIPKRQEFVVEPSQLYTAGS